MEEAGGTGLAYQAVLAEGTVEDLAYVLNRGRLVARVSHPSLKRDRDVAVQREVAPIALAGADGFVLAESGAMREQDRIERLTEDVDLFTTRQTQPRSVPRLTTQLRPSRASKSGLPHICRRRRGSISSGHVAAR